jgi:hypothetical protein
MLTAFLRYSAPLLGQFFVSYNKLRDRKFRATHDASPDKARKLIEEGMNTFKKKRRKAA